MTGVSEAYRKRLQQRKECGNSQSARCSQRMSDSPNSQSREQVSSSDHHLQNGSLDESNKVEELKNEISEMYEFYGYDATLYYVLSTTERYYEI